MTTNFMCAPSVTRNRQILAATQGRVRAIVVNAGNANVGNGPQGDNDNAMMARLAAEALRLSPDEVLTASTGIIGHFLSMEKLVLGIAECGQQMASTEEAAAHAAEAILTTDTFVKEYAVQFKINGMTAHIGGMAKGSGMIAPNMATMLSFLTTDVAIAPPVLDAALRQAVAVSFNCLTVDGDTSTSDQCLILASGAAGNDEITDATSPEAQQFVTALSQICVHLAKEVARDGEGATKLVTVRVTGGPDDAAARRVAKTIGESPLVKTALFGNDPNWGRLLMAAGRAGVPFDPNKATASLAGVEVFRYGRPASFDAAALSRAMAVKELEIHVDLGAGDGVANVYTCDFSYDYVKINAEYHT
jgi:glutamate N-acetyltransferase/amino-acid N-acetyltransferase